jgi:hypothetical protein
VYRLDGQQKARLVQIVRDESGDKLSRADFNDAMLLLFENIAGFETLPGKRCQQYLKILWQSYQTTRRAGSQTK